MAKHENDPAGDDVRPGNGVAGAGLRGKDNEEALAEAADLGEPEEEVRRALGSARDNFEIAVESRKVLYDPESNHGVLDDDEEPVPKYENRGAERGADIRQRVAEVPLLSPPECEARLIELGYRGQKHARRAASVLAYRHVRRLRRVFLEGVPLAALGPRDNYLFIGPTGSGKTFLCELLFGQILGVPSVTVDITQYSETGYVGDDVAMILSRLFETAGQDLLWSSCGVVCLDEIDKLASSRSSARFAGEGTTKDVSGFGVQRGLLNLLGGKEAPFPLDFGYAQMGPKLTMPLGLISFVACGAFSGLKTTADILDAGERIGFGREPAPHDRETIAVNFDDRILEQTAAFAQYGFLPELIGRFSRVLAFSPLDDETLRAILIDNVIADYRSEFAGEGLKLSIEDGVMSHIIAGARKRELGARGLRASLVPYLEEAAFHHFGGEGGKTVRLYLDGDKIAVGES